MEAMVPYIRTIVSKFLRGAGPDAVRKRMTSAIPEIVRKMELKDMTPENARLPVLVRDALFRLWRSIIPSGDIADYVRDQQSEKVVAAVTRVLDVEQKKDLTIIVKATAEAAIDLTF